MRCRKASNWPILQGAEKRVNKHFVNVVFITLFQELLSK